MDTKFLGIAAILGLGVWAFTRKKSSAVQTSGTGGDGGTIGINPLTQAIVRVQQGSSGQIIDNSGGVLVAAPVAAAVASGSDAVAAAQNYIGHQISGFTQEDYEYFSNLVKGMSMHEIYNLGIRTGIPGGIVPLEISAYLEYKTQGYSANFQALLTPELIARLDPVWAAEEADGEILPSSGSASPAVATTATQAPQETINYAQLEAEALERARLAAIAEAERQAEAALIAAAQAEAARTAAERAEAERQAEAARIAAAQAAQAAAQAGQTAYLATLTPEQLAQMMAGGYFGY